MVVIGVDPGLSGGICILESNELLGKFVMPTVGDELDLITIKDIFFKYKENCKIYIEKVHALPGQNISAMFRFGMMYGNIIGIVSCLNISYELVTPQNWQKIMHSGVDRSNNPKERSLIAVKRLFPSLDLRATERSKKFHDGLVDAILIAKYGEILNK